MTDDDYDFGAPEASTAPARAERPPPAVQAVAPVRALPPPAPGRMPAWDENAERAVVSAVLLDPAALPQLAAFLRPEAFFSEAHRRTYEAALAIYTSGGAVDIVTVAGWLKDRDRLGQVGGVEGLTAVIDCSPAVANVSAHGAIVANHARARATAAFGERLAARARMPIDDTQEFLDAALGDLEAIVRARPNAPSESNLDVLRRLVDDARTRREAALGTRPAVRLGLTTGFPSFDDAFGGLHGARVHFIGGREKRGKTTFARQVALHVASLGIGVVVFSTEQTREEWLIGALACRARTALDVLRGRKTDDPDGWARAMIAAADVAALPIRVIDTSEIHSGQIVQTVRALLAQRRDNEPPIGLAIVDHIHRLATNPDDRREPKTIRIGNDARRFRNACRATKLPWIILAQQRDLDGPRGSRGAVDPKPQGNCTAWSSVPEQEADLVAWLWREPKPRGAVAQMSAAGRSGTPYQLVVTNARHGTACDIALDAHLAYARFDDLAYEEQQRAGSRDNVDDEPETLIPR